MKIKQLNPPCINCITLPMCRTILTNKHEIFTIRALTLLKKCTLLSDYVHSQEHLLLDRLNRAVIVITSDEIQIEDPYERKMY